MSGATLPGRVVVLTGDGKGKTTAALGMVLRAVGHGWPVLIAQFIKSDASTGELLALRRLGANHDGCLSSAAIAMVQLGLGFVPAPEHPSYQLHRRAAEAGLAQIASATRDGRYRLVVLDEVCTAIARGLLGERAVIDVVSEVRTLACVVLTGRGATDGIVAVADTVTEMCSVKHALEQGRRAEEGIEW